MVVEEADRGGEFDCDLNEIFNFFVEFVAAVADSMLFV